MAELQSNQFAVLGSDFISGASTGSDGAGGVNIFGGTTPFEPDDLVVITYVGTPDPDGDLNASNDVAFITVYDSIEDFENAVGGDPATDPGVKYHYQPQNAGQVGDVQGSVDGLGDGYYSFNNVFPQGSAISNTGSPAPSLDGGRIMVAPGADFPNASFPVNLNSDADPDSGTSFEAPIGVPCLTAGTLIETSEGMIAAQALQIGDMVRTRDHGMQPVRFVARRDVAADGAFAPIVIAAGTLGNDCDLVVSPNHRMLVTGARVRALFGEDEMLVTAEDLIDGDRIYRKPGGTVTYVHIAFDEHEIIYAEGAATESLQPMARDAEIYGASAYAELLRIFPELETRPVLAARPVASAQEAALLA